LIIIHGILESNHNIDKGRFSFHFGQRRAIAPNFTKLVSP